MSKTLMFLLLLVTTTLFGEAKLELFKRFPSQEGGPDTRGSIWYDAKQHVMFAADHKEGLWKIKEDGSEFGQTTQKDQGLFDIAYSDEYLFGIGSKGLFIYDKEGNYLSSLRTISGESIYVDNDYAYIVNERDGISIVNIENKENPIVVDTLLQDKKFSQIRGNTIKQEIRFFFIQKEVTIHLLYITALDGTLYLFENADSKLYYKDQLTLFPGAEARKIFVAPDGLIYINSNFSQLAIVGVDRDKLKLKQLGSWESPDDHGKGQQSPAAGGVFVNEIDNKKYALITGANQNSDGYLYWLDVTDPSSITHIDTLHDTQESYGFNDVWLNDTRLYLAAHNGFMFMGLTGIKDRPTLWIREENSDYLQEGNLTQYIYEINTTKTFTLKIENQNLKAIDINLTASIPNSTWSYRYIDLSTDQEITSKITQEGYIVTNLESNSSFEIRLEITPLSNNEKQTTLTIVAANKNAPLEKSFAIANIILDQTPRPFSCDTKSYIFSSQSKTEPTNSYVINIATGDATLDRQAFFPTNINAIGYNIKDNFIWGYDRVNQKVTRVDANYKTQSYTISNLPPKSFIIGDVSSDALLYLYDQNRTIYRIDIDPTSKSYLTKTRDLTISKQIFSSDMAFNPIDNEIYTIDNLDGHLYKIETKRGEVTDLGDTQMGAPIASGALYFDKYGTFYIYNNKQGKLYKIDLSNTNRINPKAIYIADLPLYSAVDGARCTNAPIPQMATTNSDHFNLWDVAKPLTNQTISTKVVGAPIELLFASLNKEGTAFSTTKATNIRVALFAQEEQLSIWHNIVLEDSTHIPLTFDTQDFLYYNQQNRAFKEVKVKIEYEDSNKTKHTLFAKDSFALRPAKFRLTLPTNSENMVAGEQFSIQLQALSATNERIENYNETNATYQLNYQEIRIQEGCTTGQLKTKQSHFTSGEAIIQASYDEVGILNLTVEESSTHEFALIDRNDTNTSLRKIASDSKITQEFHIGKLAWSWNLKNGANSYTFFSNDPALMGGGLEINITAQNEAGKTTKNFNQQCYAKDIAIEATFRRNLANNPLQPIAIYEDTNHTKYPLNLLPLLTGSYENQLNFAIEKRLFQEGLASKSIKINFQRDSQKPLNPLRYTLTHLKASTQTTSIQQNSNKTLTYLYARAHAPAQEGVGKDMEATIFYEVYCNACDKSLYHLINAPESADEVYWYILPPSETGMLDFDQVNGYGSFIEKTPDHIYQESSIFEKLDKKDANHIEIEVKKSPVVAKITYKPLPYLYYSRFPSTQQLHHFQISLSQKPQNWAGEGALGATIDTQSNQRINQYKIDW